MKVEITAAVFFKFSCITIKITLGFKHGHLHAMNIEGVSCENAGENNSSEIISTHYNLPYESEQSLNY